jgi:UDP-glucose 4-epimerase
MRVVVTGATGNVGTSVVDALAYDDEVTSILGIARRAPNDPRWTPPHTTFATADVGRDDLETYLRGADAVIHLAWQFQPTHDPLATWYANAIGSAQVFDAAARAGVSTVLYSSSVGAYSPGADGPVDESWPTNSLPTAAYGREKAYVERVLDGFEAANPSVRVVRMRPAFIFKQSAGSEQRRLFAGPLLPHSIVRPGFLPVVPHPSGLQFQALHAVDVAAAFQRALHADVRGAFNLASEPIIDGTRLGEVTGATPIAVPRAVVRLALAGAWHLRLEPTDPALLDLALRLPIMQVTRARDELGWEPRVSATDALRSALVGIAEDTGFPTPPLMADASM